MKNSKKIFTNIREALLAEFEMDLDVRLSTKSKSLFKVPHPNLEISIFFFKFMVKFLTFLLSKGESEKVLFEAFIIY